jgi:hypothetical protein
MARLSAHMHDEHNLVRDDYLHASAGDPVSTSRFGAYASALAAFATHVRAIERLLLRIVETGEAPPRWALKDALEYAPSGRPSGVDDDGAIRCACGRRISPADSACDACSPPPPESEADPECGYRGSSEVPPGHPEELTYLDWDVDGGQPCPHSSHWRHCDRCR